MIYQRACGICMHSVVLYQQGTFINRSWDYPRALFLQLPAETAVPCSHIWGNGTSENINKGSPSQSFTLAECNCNFQMVFFPSPQLSGLLIHTASRDGPWQIQRSEFPLKGLILHHSYLPIKPRNKTQQTKYHTLLSTPPDNFPFNFWLYNIAESLQTSLEWQ